jgi:hypothetical protein
MLGGLLLGNLIDLDHILLRINGTVPWRESICFMKNFWECNGFFGYPLHTVYMVIALIATSAILFFLKEEESDIKIDKWLFWICIGALLNLLLDFVQLTTGTGFVVG